MDYLRRDSGEQWSQHLINCDKKQKLCKVLIVTAYWWESATKGKFKILIFCVRIFKKKRLSISGRISENTHRYIPFLKTATHISSFIYHAVIFVESSYEFCYFDFQTLILSNLRVDASGVVLTHFIVSDFFKQNLNRLTFYEKKLVVLVWKIRSSVILFFHFAI